MKNIFALWFLLFSPMLLPNSLVAQTYTLPIENAQEFLDNLPARYFNFSYGRPISIRVGREGNVEKHLLFRFEVGWTQKILNFGKPYVFENVGGQLQISLDQNTNHSYPMKTFKSGFSKLQIDYITLNPEWLFLTIGKKVYATTGPLIDFRVNSKHLRKYYENNQKEKTKLKGNDLLKMTNIHLGWEATFYFWGLGFNYQYTFNNFFQKAWALPFKFQSFGLKIAL